jgi:hypothetical protein
MKSNPKVRERILRHLRAAVHHQIKLWDAATSLSKLRGLELTKVLSVVEAQSITSDMD